MEANNISAAGEKICPLCQQPFTPHPKVKDRQRVCRRERCQRRRQQLNQQAWLAKNPANYQVWYQDYGQAWRQQNPDYLKQYRRQRRLKSCPATIAPGFVEARHPPTGAEKKEQLNLIQTATSHSTATEKKEQLSHSFYLLKAQALELWPLDGAKKEQLASCFA